MSKGFIDQSLVQNSALACLLITYFVHTYEKLTIKESSPDLLKILLVLPILWHKDSCNAIKSRHALKTPLDAVLSENSQIINNFELRLSEFTPITLQALNLACSTGLLKKTLFEDNIFFSITFDKWPKGYSYAEAPSDMISTIKRLSFWFKDINTPQLYCHFLNG